MKLNVFIIACTDAKDCSSAKVTGLVIFEVFAYIWMSQVIGNVALSTMAGGPFGSMSISPPLSTFLH